MPEPYLPLRGVTVLAWEQAVSLPMGTRLLADLGARVIRLEAPARGRSRARALGNDLARNKLGLSLDLRDPRGQHVFKQIVRRVDVVCENFTPRVKRKYGLTYEALARVKPDLIMLSLCGYGQTGRMSDRPTFGPGIEAASGHAQLTGYPDQPPTRPGTIVFADNISGFYAAFAIVAALLRRRLTGKGQSIDLAMYEACAYHLTPSLALAS
jgi:crotonobetainyl-CoA:carnitine CoA-transferase CaiB-like acyl-CoA transferase